MIRLERLWERDAARDELHDALGSIEELNPPADLRLGAFQTAVNLLSQRVQTQGQAAVGVPVAMSGHGRHH